MSQQTVTPRQLVLPLTPVPEPELAPVDVQVDVDHEIVWDWGHRDPIAFASAVAAHLAERLGQHHTVEDLQHLVQHSWVHVDREFGSLTFRDQRDAQTHPLTSIDLEGLSS